VTSSRTRQASPRAAVDSARQAAFDALLSVDVDDAYLNLTLPGMLAERGIADRDAAFTTELAHGSARLRGLYDAILDSTLPSGVSALQPEVRTALRLGAHQLLSMRVPAHAAVATSVELTRAAAGERPVRLVNAVLRKVAATSRDDWAAAVAPAREADLIGQLSVVHSHPRWIVEAFLEALEGDPEQTEALLVADNLPPLVTLVTRPGLSTVADLLAAGASPGRWSPYAAILAGGEPGGLRAVRSGQAGVQDEGSQLAALALARAEPTGPARQGGERWLDMCAGPGGKAALLAGLASQQNATLIASDRLTHRAALVRSGLRGYPSLPPVVAADGTAPPWRQQSFDRVLVDAPCSGLGAMRRRPEARWRRQASDVDTLVPLQMALVLSAVDSVAPGGVVAYVTCTPHRSETRNVVDTVLRVRDDIVQEDVRVLLPEITAAGPGPHVQLWPHVHGTDAMFMAVLRRRTH
jgi:16S rRNA (cytosine967-C5)-methyltransferase